MNDKTTPLSAVHVDADVMRRPLHGFGESRTRFWVRWGQQIIRFIAVTDYSQCDAEHEPRTYYKRLTHERMRPGHELLHGQYDQKMAEWYATAFPASQWCEVA